MPDTTQSYLTRYLAGEHEAVWRELAAMGDGVRDPAVLDDARAVARETMRRVRRNVETVVARLRAMGYRFAEPAQVHEPPTPALLARLDTLEAQAGPLPLALRAFYEEVGSVCLMGAHPTLSSYAKSPDLGDMLRAVGGALAAHPVPGQSPAATSSSRGTFGDAMATLRALMQRVVQTQQESARLMDEGGAPSETLRANHALAEALQARMFTPHADGPPATAREAPASDPLVVWAPHDDDVDELRDIGDPDDPDAQDEEGWTGRYAIDIAPDVFHKANVSGGDAYRIAFPDAGADCAVLELDAPSFVGYLRECFRWGGFPGLADEREPPHADVARLTEGLEAF